MYDVDVLMFPIGKGLFLVPGGQVSDLVNSPLGDQAVPFAGRCGQTKSVDLGKVALFFVLFFDLFIVEKGCPINPVPAPLIRKPRSLKSGGPK